MSDRGVFEDMMVSKDIYCLPNFHQSAAKCQSR